MDERGLPVSRQYDEERVDGRSLSEIRGEGMREFCREKCASGEVFTRSEKMTTTQLLKKRGHLFTELVDIDQQIVESMKGKDYPCIANVDGNYLHLSEKYARLPYELPLIVRPATVIGD